MKLLIVVCLLVCSRAFAGWEVLRSKDGRSVEVRIVAVSEYAAEIVRKSDGRAFRMPLDSLHPEDAERVRLWKPKFVFTVQPQPKLGAENRTYRIHGFHGGFSPARRLLIVEHLRTVRQRIDRLSDGVPGSFRVEVTRRGSPVYMIMLADRVEFIEDGFSDYCSVDYADLDDAIDALQRYDPNPEIQKIERALALAGSPF